MYEPQTTHLPTSHCDNGLTTFFFFLEHLVPTKHAKPSYSLARVCVSNITTITMLFEKPKHHHHHRVSEFQAVVLAGYGSSNR